MLDTHQTKERLDSLAVGQARRVIHCNPFSAWNYKIFDGLRGEKFWARDPSTGEKIEFRQHKTTHTIACEEPRLGRVTACVNGYPLSDTEALSAYKQLRENIREGLRQSRTKAEDSIKFLVSGTPEVLDLSWRYRCYWNSEQFMVQHQEQLIILRVVYSSVTLGGEPRRAVNAYFSVPVGKPFNGWLPINPPLTSDDAQKLLLALVRARLGPAAKGWRKMRGFISDLPR